MTSFHFNRTCVFTQEIRMHPRISFLLTTLKKKKKGRKEISPLAGAIEKTYALFEMEGVLETLRET